MFFSLYFGLQTVSLVFIYFTRIQSGTRDNLNLLKLFTLSDLA